METQPVLEFKNPATGARFGEVRIATAGEVQQALCEMRSAAPTWRDKPVAERVRVLRKFQELLIDAADEITATLNNDCSKSRQDALVEVYMVADMLSEYLRHAPRWLKRRPLPSGLQFFKRAYVEPRPFGVVAVIAPWNYPFDLSVKPVLAALLAGNTVVLKPSEVTAATGVLIENLFRRVPELSPYVRVVHGDASVGAALVQARPDYIFVTGSTATGKKISEAAAKNLTPVTCELGGKDATIILEDANLEAAAKWSIWGSSFNAGQTCMSVERAYVVEEVYDRFVELAVENTRQLLVGYTPEIECAYYLAAVSDPRQIVTIERHMEDARARGAKVLIGGERRGMFYDPTVLVNVDHSMLIMREETFGPILPIVKVKDEAEAIRLANDNAFGLSASVWTADLKRGERVARQLDVGSVIVNDTIVQFAMSMVPFGGVKESGYGRTHGREGLLEFTYSHALVVGNAPSPLDVAVLLRKPGNYRLMKTIMHVAFGATPRQRVRPLAEAVGRMATPERRKAATGAGAALGAAAVAAGMMMAIKRKK